MFDTEKLQATLQHDLDALCKTRDELRVQLALAKADARSEWERLEKRMALAEEEIGRVSAHAKKAFEEIESGSRKLLAELKAGYEHLRQQL